MSPCFLTDWYLTPPLQSYTPHSKTVTVISTNPPPPPKQQQQNKTKNQTTTTTTTPKPPKPQANKTAVQPHCFLSASACQGFIKKRTIDLISKLKSWAGNIQNVICGVRGRRRVPEAGINNYFGPNCSHSKEILV